MASVFVILLATMLAVGCSSDTKKWRLALTATQALNQDDSGEALPVVVRVYQLRGKDKFQRATFTELWKKDKELLEGDLLDRKELTYASRFRDCVGLRSGVKHGAAFFRCDGVIRESPM